MGFGSIIATGLTVVVLIVAGYLILAGALSAVNTATAETGAARDGEMARLATGLAVGNVGPGSGNSSLQLSVSNTGSLPIDLARLDVIFRLVDAGDGNHLSAAWLPYNESPGADRWHVLQLEPARETATSAHELEPGETAVLECDLIGLGPCDAGAVTVVAQNGVSASCQYNLRST